MPGNINLKAYLNFDLKRSCSCCNSDKVLTSILGESTMDVKDQLLMLHNPFAEATSQPKIPDGARTTSLGHTASWVGEYEVNAGTGHMILFPGLAGGLLYTDGGPSAPPSPTWTREDIARNYRVPLYTDTGGPDFGDYANSTTTFVIKPNADTPYGSWRIVSQGMQLKLLNATESDDGWWEAIRLTPRNAGEDWYFTTGDGLPSSIDGPADPEPLSGLIATDGAVAPALLDTSGYKTQNLSDNPTYSTGLLRDLHKVQFELLGNRDRVSYTNIEDQYSFSSSVWTGDFQKTPWHIQGDFDTSSPDSAANNWVDTVGYDMVYIRLHTRDSAPFSKFHVNVQANFEFVHENDTKEKRYETKCESIGSGAVSLHLQARRANGNAATLIG